MDANNASGSSAVSFTHGRVGTLNHCPRILSLDGGGVRGLSSLLILREVMEEIGRRSGAANTPLPCQYFDLIGGTSTGGLIAIMLGRLRMVFPPLQLNLTVIVCRRVHLRIHGPFTEGLRHRSGPERSYP
jgi:Patatin-like phospholipase